VKEGEMGQREEETVTAFLDAQAEGDIDRALNYMANDADYRIPAWKESLRDTDAIRSTLERDQATLSDMRIEVLNVASTNRLVFSERIDYQHMKNIGRDTEVHIVGVYELGPDGKIVSEREYFDMKEVEAQIEGA
jgi:limonene-1,2-epoxide hydrolase